mgnify:CR=1 FL=1
MFTEQEKELYLLQCIEPKYDNFDDIEVRQIVLWSIRNRIKKDVFLKWVSKSCGYTKPAFLYAMNFYNQNI